MAQDPHVDVHADPAVEHEVVLTAADPHLDTAATTAAAHGDGHGEAHHAPGPMDVSLPMFLWTLVTFILVVMVLKKFAFGPILAGLDQREQTIRESIDNAEKVEQELAAIDDKRETIIAQADDKAKDIVSRARKAGLEAERVIQEKAKSEATIILENADREIRSAREKAQSDLRRQSVDTAINLAGKLISENLDTDKNRDLTEKLIEQI